MDITVIIIIKVIIAGLVIMILFQLFRIISLCRKIILEKLIPLLDNAVDLTSNITKSSSSIESFINKISSTLSSAIDNIASMGKVVTEAFTKLIPFLPEIIKFFKRKRRSSK